MKDELWDEYEAIIDNVECLLTKIDENGESKKVLENYISELFEDKKNNIYIEQEFLNLALGSIIRIIAINNETYNILLFEYISILKLYVKLNKKRKTLDKNILLTKNNLIFYEDVLNRLIESIRSINILSPSGLDSLNTGIRTVNEFLNFWLFTTDSNIEFLDLQILELIDEKNSNIFMINKQHENVIKYNGEIFKNPDEYKQKLKKHIKKANEEIINNINKTRQEAKKKFKKENNFTTEQMNKIIEIVNSDSDNQQKKQELGINGFDFETKDIKRIEIIFSDNAFLQYTTGNIDKYRYIDIILKFNQKNETTKNIKTFEKYVKNNENLAIDIDDVVELNRYSHFNLKTLTTMVRGQLLIEKNFEVIKFLNDYIIEFEKNLNEYIKRLDR